MYILTTPNPQLRQKAQLISSWNKKLDQQISSMIKLLQAAKDPEGIGLAAPQVGLNKRLFILNLNHQPRIFINPKIIKISKTMLSKKYPSPKKRWLEGCLSIPKLWGFVDRPYSITLKYQLPQTLISQQQSFKAKLAASIQHELDHLNGLLFTDHLINQESPIYRETSSGLKQINLPYETR